VVRIISGQPARGPELLYVRWRSGVMQDRNLYVIDDQVAAVTDYHKTQSQLERAQVVDGFMLDAVGQLVCAYLLYVSVYRRQSSMAILCISLQTAPNYSQLTCYSLRLETKYWETLDQSICLNCEARVHESM
jgi:hypothetical protein